MQSHFQPFDLKRMLLGEQPPLYLLEVALKCVIIFLVLLLVMRLMGKRGQSKLDPMQQMLLIALGSAAGDVLLYPTVALAYAALILFGITLLTMALDELSARFQWVRNHVESKPRLLVRDGIIDRNALDKERTTLRELHAALRTSGARSVSQVQYAILEVTGEISVFLCDSSGTDNEDLLATIVQRPDPQVAPSSAPVKLRPID